MFVINAGNNGDKPTIKVVSSMLFILFRLARVSGTKKQNYVDRYLPTQANKKPAVCVHHVDF